MDDFDQERLDKAMRALGQLADNTFCSPHEPIALVRFGDRWRWRCRECVKKLGSDDYDEILYLGESR